jgi:hypothetical protein
VLVSTPDAAAVADALTSGTRTPAETALPTPHPQRALDDADVHH